MPGNIRRAEHFCQFLRRLVEYMKERIGVAVVEQESCTTFLAALQERMAIDGAALTMLLPCPLLYMHTSCVAVWGCTAALGTRTSSAAAGAGADVSRPDASWALGI